MTFRWTASTARRLFPYLFFVFVFVPAILLFLSFLRYTFRRATVSCLVPFVLCCVRGTMVMSTSQQVALAFTAVLFTFVVLPRLFGVGVGSAGKENRFDSRYGRKGEDTSALTHRRKRNKAVSFPKCPRRLERCKFPAWRRTGCTAMWKVVSSWTLRCVRALVQLQLHGCNICNVYFFFF